MATLRSFQWWALAGALGVGCTVNHAGLSPDGDTGPLSGTGGSAIAPDGGTGSGGTPSTASGGNSGTGGQVVGSGGATGTGGGDGSGSGGYFSMGGAVGSGGAPGSGGEVTASGGMPGSGGASSGGAPGSGGRAGTGGRTGNCSRYPDAMAFMPPGEDRFHCYWFRAELKTWPAARTQCQGENGGDLATLTSQAENEFVRGIARFSGEFPQIWIGATDGRGETDTRGPGPYSWVTNEAWGTYTNWNQSAPKQPDGYCDPCSNNQQSCTCDHRGTLASDGTWYDFWEKNPRAYVCEALAPAN